MHKIIYTSTIPLSLNLFYRGLFCELSQEYEIIALSSPQSELAEVAKREGVKTVAVPMRREIAPVNDLMALWRLIRIFRCERPQMVHSMTPKAGLLSMIAAWIACVPVRVHTFTGLVFPTSSGLLRRVLMLTDKMTCQCATHIIAEGEGVRNDLLHHGITKKRVFVLGFGNVRGIDLDYYALTSSVKEQAGKIRKRLGIADGVFTFVFVGRIVRDKGIHELTEAFCRLCNEREDVYLLLVGDYEPTDLLSKYSRELIDRTPYIYVTEEWIDDVRPWYAVADALVFPSYREGFPNVVIEAGAMGLPSIVTDINGSREIIIDDENGIIIPSHDEEALYHAMKGMVMNPKKAKYMGEKAHPLIASRYEQGFVRSKLKEFYRHILK